MTSGMLEGKERLSAAGTKGGNAPKYRWTDEELDIVRRDYTGTILSAEILAARLGVTKYAVRGQVQKLGIAMQKSLPWSAEELQKLHNLIHVKSVSRIAKILHRSPNAVKIKATRLKLGLRYRDDWFTKKEVCEILGVDHRKVQHYIDSGALVATYHTEQKPQQNGGSMWHIETAALRSFIIEHSGELLGRNVDIQQIVWLLAGDEWK